MRPGFLPGTTHHVRRHITAEHTVPRILPGSHLDRGAPVLASGFLLAMLEDACWQGAAPWLEAGETLIGWAFTGTQPSPAVPGDALDITATCTRISPQHDLDWSITAQNLRTGTAVAAMTHRCRVINTYRFQQGLRRSRDGLDDEPDNHTTSPRTTTTRPSFTGLHPSHPESGNGLGRTTR